jgi:hypothetical protein
MNDEKLGSTFRSFWTKDLSTILEHIERGERPASLSHIITESPGENHRRSEMIRQIIHDRCNSALKPR